MSKVDATIRENIAATIFAPGPMATSNKHVDFLDHFRGIAIIGVLLCHTLATIYGYGFVPWNGWFRDFSGVPLSATCLFPLSFGDMGVPIFFVVSGFCIHMSFHQQGQRWGSFFIRRIFRIYPAYLAALIFFILLGNVKHFASIFQHHDVWTQLLSHLFLVHNFHPSTFKAIDPPLWTLAIEAQLYLLYPALLALAGKLGWRKAMAILAGCELIIQGVDGLMQGVGTATSAAGQISWFFASSPFGYWFSWALGAFIAEAHLKNQPLPFLKSPVLLWFALAVSSYFFKPLFPFRFLLFAVVTAVVASQYLGGARPKIRIPALASNALKNTGLWSYSIYLLHYPLLFIYFYAMDWFVPREYHSDSIAFLLTMVAWLAIIPFSFLWYKIIELPGIALGKWIINKRDNSRDHLSGSVNLHGNNQPQILKKDGSLLWCAILLIVAGSFFVGAKFAPLEPEAGNNLAWSLATNPDADKRNGIRAIDLAEDACQQTQYKKTAMVGTLAAAYAEAGRFDEAIATAQKAIVMATENGETNLLQRNQELLKLYQNHLPYHEPPANGGN
jgi:peptidoglycan/LPS O-acetylase OafA/YrhL